MAKNKLALGLDIGSSSVKLVHLKEGKRGYTLLAWGEAPLPAEAVVDNQLMNSSAIVEAIRELVAQQRVKVKDVTPEAMDLLRAYAWPGNIRELRNVIFGALVAKRTGEALLVSDLPRRLWARPLVAEVEDGGALEARLSAGEFNLRAELEQLERRALVLALRRTNGNAAEAARLLGEVGRGAAKDPGGTVRTMMKRLGVRAD